MNGPSASAPLEVSRRGFLALASAAAGLVVEGGIGASAGAEGRRLRADDLSLLSPFERLHVPALRLPPSTANGPRVPIVVEMSHPMEPDHYIRRLHVENERDPVPSKGTFYFTPANGQVYLAFQARLNEGVSEVAATAECNRDGGWTRATSITIPPGAGGCAGSAPPPGGTGRDAILPPRIRIPQLLKEGRIRRDQIIDVQLEIRHPNRTGLALRDGKFVQESEPFYLKDLEVFDGEERVSWFQMTSALSDNPFITFRLRARREAPLRIIVTNSRGQRFEAMHPIRFS